LELVTTPPGLTIILLLSLAYGHLMTPRILIAQHARVQFNIAFIQTPTIEEIVAGNVQMAGLRVWGFLPCNTHGMCRETLYFLTNRNAAIAFVMIHA
jgi:hypothetical protein